MTINSREEALAMARLALAYLGVVDAHIDLAIERCIGAEAPGIDDIPKGGRTVSAGIDATDIAALLWKEMSNAGFLIGGPDFESEAHPVDKARFLAIAETLQATMQVTSAAEVSGG